MFAMVAAGGKGGGGIARGGNKGGGENIDHLKEFAKKMGQLDFLGGPKPPPPVMPEGPARVEGKHVPWIEVQKKGEAKTPRRGPGGKQFPWIEVQRTLSRAAVQQPVSTQEEALALLTHPLAHTGDPKRTNFVRTLNGDEQEYVENALETCEVARALAKERARKVAVKQRARMLAESSSAPSLKNLSEFCKAEAAAKRREREAYAMPHRPPTLPIGDEHTRYEKHVARKIQQEEEEAAALEAELAGEMEEEGRQTTARLSARTPTEKSTIRSYSAQPPNTPTLTARSGNSTNALSASAHGSPRRSSPRRGISPLGSRGGSPRAASNPLGSPSAPGMAPAGGSPRMSGSFSARRLSGESSACSAVGAATAASPETCDRGTGPLVVLSPRGTRRLSATPRAERTPRGGAWQYSPRSSSIGGFSPRTPRSASPRPRARYEEATLSYQFSSPGGSEPRPMTPKTMSWFNFGGTPSSEVRDSVAV